MFFRNIIFLLLFWAIFILEGLGLPNGRDASFYLILATPFFLFFLDIISKKKTFYPQKVVFLFLLFFLFSAISTYLSVNIQRSFEYLLLYVSFFLIFIYVFNHKDELKNLIVFSIIALPFIFSIYSLLPHPVPQSGYQFVFSKFGSHNHLGDFLMLPLIFGIYFFKLPLFIFAPFFFFAYSRSAYLALTITSILLLYYFLKNKKINLFSKPAILIVILILASFTFFFVVTSEVKNFSMVRPANEFLTNTLDLKDKYLLARRPEFVKQALYSFSQNPYFGVGPKNFFYSSIKYTSIPNIFTDSAHNLFLDLLAENGIFATLAFLAIIIFLLKNSRKDVFFFLLLALLLNFQTDYTHRMYSFFLLFFILASLTFNEKKKIPSHIPFILCTIILIIVSFMLLSNILIKERNYKLAFYSYPLNKNVYQPLIEKEASKEKRLSLLNMYGKLFRGDPTALDYIGKTYEKDGEKKAALLYYEKAYEADPFSNFFLLLKIYDLRWKKSF